MANTRHERCLYIYGAIRRRAATNAGTTTACPSHDISAARHARGVTCARSCAQGGVCDGTACCRRSVSANVHPLSTCRCTHSSIVAWRYQASNIRQKISTTHIGVHTRQRYSRRTDNTLGRCSVGVACCSVWRAVVMTMTGHERGRAHALRMKTAPLQQTKASLREQRTWQRRAHRQQRLPRYVATRAAILATFYLAPSLAN